MNQLNVALRPDVDGQKQQKNSWLRPIGEVLINEHLCELLGS